MPLRVLIVEDEPVMALDLEMIVENAGHTVVGVVDAMQAALAAAGGAAIDAAIVDIVLSRRSDGIRTARRLHDDHGVRSLFVTVHVDQRDEAMQPAWRPLGFVAKPYVEAEILRSLERLDVS